MQLVRKSNQLKKKDPTEQLAAYKSSIKDTFNDLLNETIGIKYQITLKVILKKTVLKLNLIVSSEIELSLF